MNLGNALAGQGMHAEAIRVYERVLALRPGLPGGDYNLANTLALGRPAEAVTHYERALALRPDYAEAHNNLGTVLLAQGNAMEAAERHRRALALKPDLVAAYVNLGSVLDARGRARRSDRLLPGGALARDANHAEAHNNLGGVLLTRGALSEAAACFERALALKPDLAAASLDLLKALVGLGNLERALRVARNVHDRRKTAESRAAFFLCLRDPRSIAYAADYRDYPDPRDQ